MTCCCTLENSCLTKAELTAWFGGDAKTRITSIAIGIIVGVTAFGISTAVFYALQTNCSWFRISQDAVKILDVFKSVHPIPHLLWRGTWGVYIVLLGPTIEEVCFRGFLNDLMEKKLGKKHETLKTIFRITTLSLFFGACHLSPFQNLVSNATIFTTTTLLGFLLAVLKETRKDLTTPLAAHMTFNLAQIAAAAA